MDFAAALKWLQEGMKVTRSGWETPGLYVSLRLDYKRSEARALVYEPVLMLHHSDDEPHEWCPVGSDLFAQDWLCASADGQIRWPDGTVA
ncbi:MW1434 family type I TA system toxin [Nonomuraea sp. NPDC049655]|uniref:Thoeris anti-defense Tad2 family protein n=1 Tax=Nonomuraea sp. NPDC049655 TaxID=3364355 RepID=UPI0037B1589E